MKEWWQKHTVKSALIDEIEQATGPASTLEKMSTRDLRKVRDVLLRLGAAIKPVPVGSK